MEEIKNKIYLLPNIGTAQEFIKELLDVLKEEYKEFSTHSMNETTLFLQGQKDMLGQIITMLEKESEDCDKEEEIPQFKGTTDSLNDLSINSKSN